MITKEQLLVLKTVAQMPNRLWAQAFQEYNENSGEKPLGLGCRSCYRTVLKWHEERLDDRNDQIEYTIQLR